MERHDYGDERESGLARERERIGEDIEKPVDAYIEGDIGECIEGHIEKTHEAGIDTAGEGAPFGPSFRFNPFDYRFHEAPKPVYRHLRDRSPVHYNEALNLYVLSRYEDVASALRRDDLYSFCHSDTYEVLHPEKFSDLVGFFCQDAPAHNSRRQLTGRPFTPQKVGATTPMVSRFIEYYLDCALDKVRRDRCGIELMNDIAGPISMAIIAEIVGFPSEWRDRIRRWIDLTVSRDNGSAQVQREALQASEQLLKYLYEFWESRRGRGAGEGDTIADRMIRIVDEGRLSKQHGISFLWALCFAGQEATAKLFGNAVYLARQNNLDYILHRSPGLLDEFLDEVMRFDSPAQIVYRTLLDDCELRGVPMQKGARVALLLGSANVDERAFGTDAGLFRMGRCVQHDLLTFGWGAHYCLGRQLGEMEVRLCLKQFFARVRSYRIDRDQCARVHTSTIHGFSRLPLVELELV